MKGATSDEPTAIYKKIQNYIFKFSDLLGQGNFSKVYSGTNELTNQIVAIKIVELESLKSKKLEELLFSEIEVLKRLNHPNILRCYDVFTSNRNCYIITELCNEGDLESKLRKQRSFSESKAHTYIRDIFEGLAYLYDNQVIHRDIKVANVFIHNGKAKIADFGFAKFTAQKFKDISIGSPLYMSPQGFVNNIYGPKTDVWAFGVLIFELLHGLTPYSNCKTENQLRQSLSIPIARSQIKGEVSSQLKEVIMACMEVDEAKRISIPQLKDLPYFRKSQGPHFFLQKGFGQGSDERLRSPTDNGEEPKVPKTLGNHQKSDRNVEGEVNYLTQQSYNRKENEAQKPMVSLFVPQPQAIKNTIDRPQKPENKERRAISSQRNIPNERPKSTSKQKTERIQRGGRIITGMVSFKQCVNILHYARLIFKFLLTLKVSEYSNSNELFRLTRWLMDILTQIGDKMERKEVIYEGQNAALREKKLREVREEYSKKYTNQLDNYIQPQTHYGEAHLTIEYMLAFTLTVHQKYDSLLSRDSSTSLLMLAHCILLIYHCTRLLKECREVKNYSAFTGEREVEQFLNMKKEQITPASYQAYRHKFIPY